MVQISMLGTAAMSGLKNSLIRPIRSCCESDFCLPDTLIYKYLDIYQLFGVVNDYSMVPVCCHSFCIPLTRLYCKNDTRVLGEDQFQLPSLYMLVLTEMTRRHSYQYDLDRS